MSMHRSVFAITLVVLTSACAAHTPSNTSGHHPAKLFRLVNATLDSVTALAIAPTGSNQFRTIDLGGPLQGGLNAATFRIPAGDCLRDLRITFRDGKVAQPQPIDMCRSDGVRIGAR